MSIAMFIKMGDPAKQRNGEGFRGKSGRILLHACGVPKTAGKKGQKGMCLMPLRKFRSAEGVRGKALQLGRRC